MPLLTVEHLRTRLIGESGSFHAVDDVSFIIKKGEALGIVGESGCGKTMLGLSLMRLVPHPPGSIVGGSVRLESRDGQSVDLLRLKEEEMRKVRGKRIAMIFQEPMTSLNPLFTIGDQIGETIKLHEGGNRKLVRDRAMELLELVGIPAPSQRINAFPHELSGGMRQRTMIAIALACRPDLLIADEPTTALDVTIQAQILELLRSLRERIGMALLLITHDLGVVAEVVDRVVVMYAGKIVEEGAVGELFASPRHPYTQALLASIPSLRNASFRTPLPTIPGRVPNLAQLPVGCSFQDRCSKVQPRCRQEAVPDDPCRVGRLVRCFYAA